jgi:acyl dehydratase
MNIDLIRALRLASIEQKYDARDTILYALGLGYGSDPLDEMELPFVYEQHLRAVPSMCNTLCHPGFWLRDPAYRVNWVKILHAEQHFEIHAPLPPTGTARGEYSVTGIEDKGAEKGALLHQQKVLYDAGNNCKLATVRSTLFLRGDGGEGSFGQEVASAAPLPERTPDRVLEIPTTARTALVYRLSGDWNPLHADPSTARKAGFDRPILQGLCTLGIACRAILRAYAHHDPACMRSMFVRFSSPFFPGETLRLELHEDGSQIRFRAVAAERAVVVLDRCSAQITAR